MKLKRLNDFLMYILIFFIIFASALNYTYMPSAVSYVKDFIIFYFGILLLVIGKIKKPSNIGWAFYALFIIVAIASWFGIVNNTENSNFEIVSRILRYLEFFILFFVFANLEKLCTVSYNKLIKYYITLSIILIFVNIFGYFVPNPIVSIYIESKVTNKMYRNRITVGQPATSAYPMIISFIYLLICSKNKKITTFEILLLLIGIIISTSVTGILSVIATIGIFFLLNASRENRKKLIIALICISIIGMVAFKIITAVPKLNDIYEKQKSLLYVKIGSLFNENLNDLSINARNQKYEDVKQNIQGPLQNLFGIGLWGYNANEIDVGSLENTYITMKVCYGIFGEIIFIIFLAKHILTNLKKFKNKDYLFMLSLFIVFAMHSYTLEVLYSPTISYTLPLFYCYIKQKQYMEENLIENTNS